LWGTIHPGCWVSSGRNGSIVQGSFHALDFRLEDEASKANGVNVQGKIQWQCFEASECATLTSLKMSPVTLRLLRTSIHGSKRKEEKHHHHHRMPVALAEAPAVLLWSMDRILGIQVSTTSLGEQDKAVQVRQ
jgi:hypothetical protein